MVEAIAISRQYLEEHWTNGTLYSCIHVKRVLTKSLQARAYVSSLDAALTRATALVCSVLQSRMHLLQTAGSSARAMAALSYVGCAQGERARARLLSPRLVSSQYVSSFVRYLSTVVLSGLVPS